MILAKSDFGDRESPSGNCRYALHTEISIALPFSHIFKGVWKCAVSLLRS